MNALYRGFGGNWSPHADYVDDLMTKRMAARGFLGKRTGEGSLHVSPSFVQALDYAKDGRDTHVQVVTPSIGSTVTWVPGMADMLLSFGIFTKDLYWSGYRSDLLQDAQGDLDLLDTYLSMGRQKKAIGAFIDMFLDTLSPKEITIEAETDLWAALGEHTGEVWITGPCVCEAFVKVDPQPDEDIGCGM